jgi:hypothetical protein
MSEWDYTGVRTVPDVPEEPRIGVVAAGVET